MATSMDSDDEEDTFVTLGTPLEPWEDDEPRKKPFNISELPVKDQKGRQRFHGAFTGGFSAGYFNTVGSKEGWTPSTFVSSREKRVDQQHQHPEDFMDDADLDEHGIAPRKLVTSGEYTSEERKRKRLDEAQARTSDSVIPGAPALIDLVVPEKISIGVKLLRKMGWKEGQGVGPRISKKKKKHQKSNVKVYGCALPSSSEEEDIDDEQFLSNITFAPYDAMAVSMVAKDNTHGLGYRGIDPRSALPSSHINLFEPPPIKKKGNKGIRGQAFGVGALEDEDDDIYAVDSMSNYDMTMELEDKDNTFGWTAPGRNQKGQKNVPVGYIGKVLEGFSLCSKPLIQKKDFPPPSLPSGFRPVHVFLKPTDMDSVSERKDHAGRRKQESQDAVSRGLVLGETPIFKSVFDLVPKEDRARMEAAKNSKSPPVPSPQPPAPPSSHQTEEQRRTSQPPAPVSSHLVDDQRKTNQSLFQGAGFNFRPFMKDPKKQERYDKYLTLVRQGKKDPYEDIVSGHMTEWEREREKEEFTKAAKLYKPLAGAMATRFTRGKHSEDDTKVDVPADDGGDKNDQMKAAEMKMYGKLTRDVLEWHPHKLLCRRFNVPDPYPSSSIVGLPTVKRDKYSIFNFLNFATTDSEPEPPERLALTDSSVVHGQESESGRSQDKNRPQGTKSFQSESRAPQNEGKGAERHQSSKHRSMRSIFSHLLDEESGQKSSNVTKREETMSLGQNENPVSSETTVIEEEGGEKSASSEVIEVDSKVKGDSDEDRLSLDLFKAIFRNTDSESSSSSENEDMSTQELTSSNSRTRTVEKGKVTIEVDDGIPDTTVQNKESPAPTSSILPGGVTVIENIQQRLSPQLEDQDTSKEEYGPPLPPPGAFQINSTVSSSREVEDLAQPSQEVIDLTQPTHRKKKHKHKEKKVKKDKKEKHKKSKHKKKHHKKKEKKKKTKHPADSDDSENDADSSSSESDSDKAEPNDRELLQKIRSLPAGQRLRASDFM